jgi:hypothetical protein
MPTDSPVRDGGPSEYEKWEKECAFRERQLALAEQESALKAAEAELRQREHQQSRWRNPLLIAIGAAAIAAFGNIYVAVTNGKQGRDLEDRKSEQTRILEMIKTGNPDSAANNLRFLLEAGLITDPDRKQALEGYLASRRQGSGVSLPSATPGAVGGIIGVDDTVPVAGLPRDHPLSRLTGAVGQIEFSGPGGTPVRCTGVAIGEDRVLTADFCVPPLVGSARPGTIVFRIKIQGRDQDFPATLVQVGSSGADAPGYALLRIPGLAQRLGVAIPLATQAPRMNEPLSMILFRAGEARVTTRAADCQVKSIAAASITHGCDTGGQSAGSPLLNGRNEIVGLHLTAGATARSTALRGDWIASRMRRPAE